MDTPTETPNPPNPLAAEIAAILLPQVLREVRRATRQPGQFLTLREAARFLGKSESLFRLIRHQPGFPKLINIRGKKPVYRLSDLKRWVESRPPARGKGALRPAGVESESD